MARCVESYIRQPNAIILAICAATDDLATVAALKAAKQVDPDCRRTIGVLTKVDCIQSGTEMSAADTLSNSRYKLAMGWSAVFNRSQKDIQNKVTLNAHLKVEQEYFQRHEQLSDYAECCGIPALRMKLSKILSKHIEKTLPSLMKTVHNSYKDLVK